MNRRSAWLYIGLIIWLLAVLHPLSGVAAGMNDPEPILELNLDQAIRLALEQNADFYLIALDLRQAEAAYNRAILIDDTEMIETTSEVLDQQQQNFSKQKRSLIATVKKMYYDLIQQEEAVVNQEKVVRRAEKQFGIDQVKFEAGIISFLDIQRSENNLHNTETDYEQALIALESKYQEFNHYLGLDLACLIELTEELTVEFIPFKLNLDEACQLALASDASITAAAEAVIKAKENVAASDNPFTPRADLEKAEVEQEKAEIKLEQTKVALYFSIRTDYYNLKGSETDIHTKKRQLGLEQQVLQSEEAKYSAGIISNEAVVAQQEKLAQAEKSYTTALWNYAQSRSSFLEKIGQPEPLWGEEL